MRTCIRLCSKFNMIKIKNIIFHKENALQSDTQNVTKDDGRGGRSATFTVQGLRVVFAFFLFPFSFVFTRVLKI